MKQRKARTLVLGLGNPILSDDAVGPRVARGVGGYVAGKPGVEVREASVGGLRLLDEILGYRKVVIIDSIRTKGGTPGQVYSLSPQDFRGTEHLSGPHEVSFVRVLEMAHKQRMDLPEQIAIVAIEIKEKASFGEEMSPEVEAAVPHAVKLVLKEVGFVG